MGSKDRMVPPHLRRPAPGPGIVHPDQFGHVMRAPPGAFPPFDRLPPIEVLEHKLGAQHTEMRKLATENQRLAATHGVLREELAAAQHELRILHSQIGAVKSEKEQQANGLMDKIAKMETDLKAAEPVKTELQKARAEAEGLVAARHELISKVQQLTQDLQRAHSDARQLPPMMAELEGLRQEYQHCRVTYDYEKKLYSDHLESLQVMEKNYVTMAREVDNLRAELTSTANLERRAGAPYGGPGYKENEASGHYQPGQHAFNDSYSNPQGRPSLPGGGAPPPSAPAAAATATNDGTPAHAGSQSGPTPAKVGYEEPPKGSGYDAQRGPSYDAQRPPAYDPQRRPGFDPQRGAGFDPHRGAGFDPQRGAGFDPHRGTGFDPQHGAGYDAQRVAGFNPQHGAGFDPQRGAGFDPQHGGGYDAQRVGGFDGQRGYGYEAARGPYDIQRGPSHDPAKPAAGGYDAAAAARGGGGNHQGQGGPPTNAPAAYGSGGTPTTRAGSGYEAQQGGSNAARR